MASVVLSNTNHNSSLRTIKCLSFSKLWEPVFSYYDINIWLVVFFPSAFLFLFDLNVFSYLCKSEYSSILEKKNLKWIRLMIYLTTKWCFGMWECSLIINNLHVSTVICHCTKLKVLQEETQRKYWLLFPVSVHLETWFASCISKTRMVVFMTWVGVWHAEGSWVIHKCLGNGWPGLFSSHPEAPSVDLVAQLRVSLTLLQPWLIRHNATVIILPLPPQSAEFLPHSLLARLSVNFGIPSVEIQQSADIS